MKTLYFNRQTLLGEFKTPISLEVQVQDDFELTKNIQEVKEYKQKENEDGEKIYQKEVFNREEKEVIVGYDEVIEKTDLPLMINVQKVNEDGEKLYTENIYNEEGELVDTFESTKESNENGELNTPIMEEVQKVSDNGNLIYLKPIIEIQIEETFSHYEETTEVTDTPIMLPVYVTVEKNVFSNIEDFTINEVIEANLGAFIEGTDYDSVACDMFLDENDLDLPKCFANTGVGILQLPPKGFAQTKSITLTSKAQSFQFIELDKLPKGISVYVNTKKVTNGLVALSSPVSNITIKFVNTTDKYLDIKSYCVLYKEV